jgi:hypothetical protein
MKIGGEKDDDECSNLINYFTFIPLFLCSFFSIFTIYFIIKKYIIDDIVDY